MTIVGSGTGAAISTDQLRFTSVPVTGDFKLVARVASFTGGANSQVGLAVRENFTATCSVGGIYFMPSIGSVAHPNKFVYQQRNMEPGALYKWSHPQANGVNTPIATPFWLQLVRVGNNFAVYRSTDGVSWSQVKEVSGSAFAVSGTVNVGFVVASGGADTVTAVIDSIYLNKTATSMMPWRSSWTANTLSTDETSHVSGHVNALWVAPDGACYANSAWEEAGEACKVYKDGKVLGRMTASTASFSFEGSIAGSATNIYLMGNLYGVGLFRAANFGDGHRIQTATPLHLNGSGPCRVSGLLFNPNNSRLYVSRVADDPATQQVGKVLIVDPAKNLYFTPGAATWVNTVINSIDTTGVTNPAPEAVYQSQFECLGAPTLTIPGLTANFAYNVRLHFAEFKATAAGQRKLNLTVSGAPTITDYNIFATTGAKYKADAKSFNATSSGTGTLSVTVAPVVGSAVINGIEILDGSNVVKLINCGGGTVGSWENNTHEESSFAFTRPGPLCVDKRGNLWIIQEGTTYPASNKFSFTPGWAAVKCHDANGNYLSKQITDLINPTAIYYDDRNGADRLLVVENGPNQNIRIYTNLTGTPTCTGTFGYAGGVFSGSTPGLVYDAAAGNDARFFGPTGVGMDSSGNLYVASGGAGTELKKFAVSGTTWSTTAAWKLQGVESVNCGDFDPSVNASDIWTAQRHYTMNYSGTTPGGEWTLKSQLWNPISASGTSIPHPAPATSVVYRNINGTPFMFTADQAFAGTVHIYRFVGEQTKYCGRIKAAAWFINVWLDGNGDGLENDGSFTQPQYTNWDIQAFDVDANGNIYLGMGGAEGPTARYVHKMTFQGITNGVPVYNSVGYVHQVIPAPFNTTWAGRLRYVGGASDTMYLLSPETPSAADGTYGGILARYNNWNTTPSLVFSTTLPKPTTDYNFLEYPGAYYSVNIGFKYMAFDVAGNYVFLAELWGPVHVVNAATGACTTKLMAGPEINGSLVWEDMCMGLRAHYNASTNEYYVLTENSGYKARHNLFRWKPVEKTQTACYGLNQTVGTAVPDTSGHNKNGTLNGTVSGTTWKPGRFGNAVNFNGTDNYITLPDNLIKNHTTLTFACWFRISSAAGCPILGYANSAPPAVPVHYLPAVYVGTDGKLRGQYWKGGTVAPITSTETVNDGMWHHVALVGNVNTQSLYLDGQLVGSLSGTINHLAMQYNFLGYSYSPGLPALDTGHSYFQGDLDDARFYSQALSAEDVANLAAH